MDITVIAMPVLAYMQIAILSRLGARVLWGSKNTINLCTFRMKMVGIQYSSLADRTNGRAYATVLRPTFVVVSDVMYRG